MKFVVKHYTDKRIKLKIKRKYFTEYDAIKLEEYIKTYRGVCGVKLYEKIGEIKIKFTQNIFVDEVLDGLAKFSNEEFMIYEPSNEAIDKQLELNAVKKKIKKAIVIRYISRMFLPKSLGIIVTLYKAKHYVKEALKSIKERKMEVSILDAVAIVVSIARKDFSTANSVMFLLNIGESLEQYTHKKAIAELSRSLQLNIETVWLVRDGVEVSIPFSDIKVGDILKVRAGSIIPCDGIVESGVAMVNQSTLTGESVPVEKSVGKIVYAATVVQEGEISIKVNKVAGNARIDEIIKLIESSEKMKSKSQINAYNMADKLVKYSFIGFGVSYILTRNINRALSFLMVDYSCALKLATPIAIMSAMKECGDSNILVKGGKYLENIVKADTIIFDKTGTLTESTPTVKDIIPFEGYTKEEVLKVAACLEEHFPHSIANAVVNEAKNKNILHNELHDKVNYVVAHGISSTILGEKAIIGSHHFVFEDEKIEKTKEVEETISKLDNDCSFLFLAIGNKVVGIITIVDPLKKNVKDVIYKLRQDGIKKLVMLTGDNEKTAKTIADRIGIDEYIAQVLPVDKSDYILKEKSKGNIVIMVGDGVNDSPALSVADVGISMGSGSDIARQVSDILIKNDDLNKLVYLRRLSLSLQKRINKSYSTIVTVNTALIGLGLFNVIMPNVSALFHNMATVLVAGNCMRSIEKEEINEEISIKDSKYISEY